MQSLDNNRNRRILVIDDNPSIHNDFRKIFVADRGRERLNDAEAAFFGEAIATDWQIDFELDVAHQGEEGLEMAVLAVAENRPHALAFVDMRMPPGWDGLTTIEELWKVAPDLQIVICTAYSDHSWSNICQRLGETDQLLILKKPFDNAEVCQLALALTEKWNLTQQTRLKQEDLERLVDKRTAQLREKEQALRQKQKLEAIGALAGGVAHEFNNLLQVICGYVWFAMSKLPPDEQPHQDLLHVVEAVDRAAAITGQLLSFSRQKPTQKSNQEVNGIVAMSLEMVRPVLGEQIELDVNLNDKGCIVRVDADIMSQVLLNLCINARDAMPSGGRLLITTEQTEVADRRGKTNAQQHFLTPGHYTVISVADSGCGIPADMKDRIFDPFFTTKDLGSGMGLAMVIGAVQDHDGTVTVESVEGQGSTFKVFLPIVPDVAEDAPRSATEGKFSSLTGKETILVAEDDPVGRDLAVRVLREAGYSVIVATDGVDAVNKFEQNLDAIDMAVLDVVMPMQSGHWVYERMKELNPEIKVVFCTGYNPDTGQTDSFEDETVSTLCKPLAPQALLSIVRLMLDETPLCQPC